MQGGLLSMIVLVARSCAARWVVRAGFVGVDPPVDDLTRHRAPARGQPVAERSPGWCSVSTGPQPTSGASLPCRKAEAIRGPPVDQLKAVRLPAEGAARSSPRMLSASANSACGEIAMPTAQRNRPHRYCSRLRCEPCRAACHITTHAEQATCRLVSVCKRAFVQFDNGGQHSGSSFKFRFE
jgi:hypothetical protein